MGWGDRGAGGVASVLKEGKLNRCCLDVAEEYVDHVCLQGHFVASH